MLTGMIQYLYKSGWICNFTATKNLSSIANSRGADPMGPAQQRPSGEIHVIVAPCLPAKPPLFSIVSNLKAPMAEDRTASTDVSRTCGDSYGVILAVEIIRGSVIILSILYISLLFIFLFCRLGLFQSPRWLVFSMIYWNIYICVILVLLIVMDAGASCTIRS